MNPETETPSNPETKTLSPSIDIYEVPYFETNATEEQRLHAQEFANQVNARVERHSIGVDLPVSTPENVDVHHGTEEVRRDVGERALTAPEN